MDMVERRLSLRLSSDRAGAETQTGGGREGDGVGDETTS